MRSFAKLVEKGYIYKDLKPVNWCATCETALAEAEVEYEKKASPSIYVKFKLEGTKYFIIWTTTPWTLVANVAVALHPEAEYAFVETPDKEIFIIAKTLVESATAKLNIKDYKIVKTVKGKGLEGLEARHPFIERISKVVLAEYVSLEDGTGCVHTAPGHGEVDYLTGKKYGLETIMPVDSKGRFDRTAGEFSGLEVTKANAAIIEKLKSINALMHEEKITH